MTLTLAPTPTPTPFFPGDTVIPAEAGTPSRFSRAFTIWGWIAKKHSGRVMGSQTPVCLAAVGLRDDKVAGSKK